MVRGGYPAERLPIVLARLHRDMAVDEPLRLEVAASPWPASELGWLLTGAGFAVGRIEEEGAATLGVTVVRARTLADTVGPDMKVLVCGLNPSLVAADAGYGYAGRSNRFWPAAVAAGLVSRPRDPLHALEVDGLGITDLVKRATRAAAEVKSDEYRNGLERVRWLVGWLRPGQVLFVGLAGWRIAVDRTARPGWQAEGLAGVPAYVMPSTSGLNARTSGDELVAHMRAVLRGEPRRLGF